MRIVARGFDMVRGGFERFQKKLNLGKKRGSAQAAEESSWVHTYHRWVREQIQISEVVNF